MNYLNVSFNTFGEEWRNSIFIIFGNDFNFFCNFFCDSHLSWNTYKFHFEIFIFSSVFTDLAEIH